MMKTFTASQYESEYVIIFLLRAFWHMAQIVRENMFKSVLKSCKRHVIPVLYNITGFDIFYTV